MEKELIEGFLDVFFPTGFHFKPAFVSPPPSLSLPIHFLKLFPQTH